jgi:hypothetical protein
VRRREERERTVAEWTVITLEQDESHAFHGGCTGNA